MANEKDLIIEEFIRDDPTLASLLEQLDLVPAKFPPSEEGAYHLLSGSLAQIDFGDDFGKSKEDIYADLYRYGFDWLSAVFRNQYPQVSSESSFPICSQGPKWNGLQRVREDLFYWGMGLSSFNCLPINLTVGRGEYLSLIQIPFIENKTNRLVISRYREKKIETLSFNIGIGTFDGNQPLSAFYETNYSVTDGFSFPLLVGIPPLQENQNFSPQQVRVLHPGDISINGFLSNDPFQYYPLALSRSSELVAIAKGLLEN